MVKAQKSAGRKSSLCLRRKTDQAEMEDGHLEPQRPPQEEPAGSDQSLGRTHYQLENCGQICPPYDDQERSDSAAHLQAKPMWKPIPPLLPEPHRNSATSGARDQSCQTDEQLQQTSAYKHGLNNTGLCAEPGDPPLLQQPLQTSKSGIQQIIECFRSGTNELKQMLLKEVDTIFECKLCRSLFRGLPNLITHKEYYCLSRLPESDGSPGDDRQSVAMKDLLDAIYPRTERPDYVVRLEPIQTTNKAVFQYIATEEELARYPSHTPSARESPVAWEGEPTETTENNQTNQPGPPETDSSSANNPGQKVEEEAKKEEQPQPEDEGSNSGVEDVTISCCLCGQDFNSRRSIRRHCRKMHRAKLEELRKFTETRTVPTSLLSMVKGRPRTLSTPPGKSCPVCLKTFATKANVRRHFDEVHQGVRRDPSPSVASRSTQPFPVEVTPPRKSNNSSPTRSHNSKSTPVNPKTTPSNQNQAKPPSQPPASPQANPALCRCTLCKRNYSSQLMLKRHMRIVHKIYSMKSNRAAAAAAPANTSSSSSSSNNNNNSSSKDSTSSSSNNNNNNNNSKNGSSSNNNSSSSVGPSSNNIRVKEEAVEPCEEDEEERVESSSVPPAAQNPLKVKEEEPPLKAKMAASASSSRGTGSGSGNVPGKMNKLSVGFDFKQLFCKLCKRQFSSRQNLTKHIELHTDGNDIFIKFYRCPLCRYESRRKRDVLRHVTVVHKKSSTYLAKIMPKLESRAVKRLAEVVLNSTNKRTGSSVKEEVNGRHVSSSSSSSAPSMPVTRKQEGSTTATATSSAAAPSSSSSSSAAAPPPAPPSRKQDLSSPALSSSPPVTRKQERQQSHQQRPVSPPQTRRSEKHSLYRNSSTPTPTPTPTVATTNPTSSHQAPNTRRHEAQSESSTSSSTEVKVTKNFSLHACDQCGRAFAKKLYLESHKRSHRNVTSETSRRKGVSTRSKSLVW